MTLQRLILNFTREGIEIRTLYRSSFGNDPNTRARRWEEDRRAWCDYFGRLAECLGARAEGHDDRAQALVEKREESP
jgi:hypothetical protein